MKRVSIKNIKKDFYSLTRGKTSALKNIDLEIDPGSFFVLLGPSGCGKSTLLNIIAGIEKPTSGEISFGDQVVVSVDKKIFLSPKERDVAMVFQSYALYPHMTIFNNIAFPLNIAGLKKDEIKEKVEKTSEILQLKNLLNAKPKELSGGQRQRVALGRAIIRNPNVLLLDEPLSNLDALLRISMRSELKQIQRQLNITTIFVTHDQTEAMSLGDKIAVLNESLVLQTGTPDEIYNKPANSFVAKFIGTPPMNLLDGSILQYSNADMIQIGNFDGNNITLGMRPEHIKIVNPDEGLFKGKIKLISSLGSETIIYVDVHGYEILVRETGESAHKEEDIIGLSLNKEKLFIFEKSSRNVINI
jgi:multiple sugar transport system ATP-binding protein